jgi:cytochrome P450 family 6
VITSCAYGIKTDSLNNPDQPIVTYAKKIFAVEGKFSLIVSVTLPKLAKFLKLEPFSGAAIRYFRNLTNKIVKERNENSEKFLRES